MQGEIPPSVFKGAINLHRQARALGEFFLTQAQNLAGSFKARGNGVSVIFQVLQHAGYHKVVLTAFTEYFLLLRQQMFVERSDEAGMEAAEAANVGKLFRRSRKSEVQAITIKCDDNCDDNCEWTGAASVLSTEGVLDGQT